MNLNKIFDDYKYDSHFRQIIITKFLNKRNNNICMVKKQEKQEFIFSVRSQKLLDRKQKWFAFRHKGERTDFSKDITSDQLITYLFSRIPKGKRFEKARQIRDYAAFKAGQLLPKIKKLKPGSSITIKI